MGKLPFRTGLVSVSFRPLPAERVIALAVEAKLDAVEWGGDVHVPHGNLELARAVRKRCADAGIACGAYGSYYRVGGGDPKSPPFEDVLATAAELGAPAVRVWAGGKGSADTEESDAARISEDLRRVCDLAAARSIDVALEYHGGTLTDAPESAVSLVGRTKRPNLFTYWQPRHGLTVDENLRDIAMLRPYLLDIHVFHWWPDHRTRHPLAAGVDRWRAYLNDLASDHRPRTVSLEFVRDDEPEQLLEDAGTLRSMLGWWRDGEMTKGQSPMIEEGPRAEEQ